MASPSLEAAAAMAVPSEVARLHKTFATGKTKTLQWRREQLQQMLLMVKENRDEILTAIVTDLGNPVKELTNLSETGAVVQEIEFALANLEKWMAPDPVAVGLVQRPASAFVKKEPYGVVLIISPWNYPFRLLFLPAVGAIAAGNAVVLKPSEVSAHTSAVIKKLADRYLDRDAIATFEGGVPVSSALLKAPFDYMFYTGNTEVGKIVMRAAAEQLVPVTLELGGKSPVYVDASANIDVAVNRIAFGKAINAGQTCVAPDYILVHNSVKDKFVQQLADKWTKWFGPDFEASKDYSRIITARHAQRLTQLIDQNKAYLAFGGKASPEKRFVQPSLFVDPPASSELMREEIFGPLLPVLGVDSVDAAIAIINSKPKPLALYVFTSDDKVADKVINNTSSGGAAVNQVVQHIGLDAPFGGVGPSGMGSYNKKYSFDTFSHHRIVLKKTQWPESTLAYPPYTESKRKTLASVADGIKLPVGMIVGAGVAVAAGVALVVSRL